MTITNTSQQLVVSHRAAADGNQAAGNVSLFRPDGSPLFGAITTATAIGTAAKTVTAPEPEPNSFVVLKFTNGNSASSPTVAFNGGSARAIQLGGVAVTGAKLTVAANGVAVFWFDGTILHQLGTVA